MDFHDSCSMTPPLSPPRVDVVMDELPSPDVLLPEETDPVPDNGVVFVCKGESRVVSSDIFHPCGPLLSGCLHRHVNYKERLNVNQQSLDDCSLFGYNFTLSTVCTQDIHTLFKFAKQRISEVVMFPASSLTKDQSDALLTIRRQLKEFLDYINKFLINCSQTNSSPSIYSDISSHLHGLLLHFGRLSEHRFSSSHVIPGLMNQTKSSHIFHMHLDLYWGALQVASIIDQLTFGECPPVRLCCDRIDSNSVSDLTSQIIQLILWDIATLSVHKYQKLTSFPCSCVKELVVMIIHILSWRHKSGLGENFWSSFNGIIQGLLRMSSTSSEMEVDMEIDSDVFYNPPSMNVENPAGLGLWLIVNIAPLFTYDDQGKLTTQAVVCSNYPVVQNLVKKCISCDSSSRFQMRATKSVGTPNIDEGNLQHYMKCCVKLSHIWEPSVTLVMTLWDYFCSRLNTNFSMAALGIGGLASIRKTSLSLLGECRTLTQRDEFLSQIVKETSFSVFLHILSHHLDQFMQRGSTGEWRQLKGRIFSKFHHRRMQELRETGLNNLTKLFITLTLVVQLDLETVAGKLCDLYELLETPSMDVKIRSVIWKGMFSLCMVYVEKKRDISFLAERLAKSFNTVCSEYCQHVDTMTKQKLYSVMLLYLENLSDVLEHSSQLNLSQHKLIGDGLSQVLPICRENELHHILSQTVNIITHIRSLYSSLNPNISVIDGTREIINSLWQIFYPFCKTHATTQTPPPELADLVASLTLSVADLGEDKMSVCASFQYFALREDVHIRLTCRYVDHVLDNVSLMSALSVGLPDSSLLLIHTWLRCSLLTPQPNQLINLNRVMLSLPVVRSVFENADMEIPVVMEAALIQFFKAFGQWNQKVEGLKNKIALRTTACSYFHDIMKFVTPVLRNYSPLESLSCVYRVTGQLIKSCAPILYVKSQPDCPLPAIIDRLVLPHSLIDVRKTVHPNLLSVLKEHLHLFVQGLCQLDYHRDPYIQRRLRDIIIQFIQRFPVKSSSGQSVGTAQAVHPIVACLGKSLSKTPSVESSKFRQFAMSLVVENFLTVTSMNLPQSATMGLSFITEVFRRTMSAEEITRDATSVLEVLLEYSLLSESSAVKQHVINLLQIVLEACAKQNNNDLVQSLHPLVNRFVEKYIRLHPVKVLTVSLEKVAILYPDLMLSLLTSLSDTLLYMERKRGVGADRKVRDAYYKLLGHLGQRGDDEKLKLENAV